MINREALTGELVDAAWRKSSHCDKADCVEVARLSGGHVAVRDSKDPAGPALLFTAGEWAAFVAGAAAGEFTRD